MHANKSECIYLARRAEQEAVAAIQAGSRAARAAHEVMCLAYSARMLAALARQMPAVICG